MATNYHAIDKCLAADGEGGLPGGNGQDGGGLPGKDDGDGDDGKPSDLTDPRVDETKPTPECNNGVCTCPLGWKLQSGQCYGKELHTMFV